MYIPPLGRLELDERCQRYTPSSVSAAGIISSNFLELPTAVTRHVCTHTATMVFALSTGIKQQLMRSTEGLVVVKL